MRAQRQPMESSTSRGTARQLFLFLAVGYYLRLPASHGFVQRVSYRRSPRGLPIPSSSSLAAVQVDPQQQQERKSTAGAAAAAAEQEEREASARRLDKLLEKTARDDVVLKEIAGHIEILCCSDSDDVGDNNKKNNKQSSTTENGDGGTRNEQQRGQVNAAKNEDEDTTQSNTDDEDDAARERRKLAARAALLGSRSPLSKGSNKPPSSSKRANSRTTTSVGVKRVGSASRARQGPGVTKRIMDAVRKSASSNNKSNGSSNNKPNVGNNTDDDESNSPGTLSSSMASAAVPLKKSRKLNPSRIHSAVFDLLERQKKGSSPYNTKTTYGATVAPASPETSLTRWNREPPQLLHPPSSPSSSWFSATPPPGTVLTPPTTSSDVSSSTTKLQFPDCLTIRVAHGLQAQDTELAHLRLSVFSDFSPEVRRQLVPRSVNAVVTRRMKGATCLLATIPPSIAARRKNRPPIILGSAECSYHEFDGTTLGRRRPAESILYITEVAVSPNARRRGIGKKLLEAIDLLAEMRKVETLYLHVDVDNQSALALYENAGYQKVDKSEPMFMEFTTKLNLHDGATKGRNHFLLYKDMVKCPTWLADNEQVDASFPTVATPLRSKFHHPPPPPHAQNAGTLGFEVPQ